MRVLEDKLEQLRSSIRFPVLGKKAKRLIRGKGEGKRCRRQGNCIIEACADRRGVQIVSDIFAS